MELKIVKDKRGVFTQCHQNTLYLGKGEDLKEVPFYLNFIELIIITFIK